MTPEQLRMVAARIRRRWSPPDAFRMSPAEYVSHEAMHALAWALEEQAEEER